jgi:hypothetical protein
LENDMGRPWFGARKYGIGIGPKTAAGWVSILIYCVLMTAAPIAELVWRWPVWTVPVASGLFTLALIVLIILKRDGEPLRWRWGGR